MGPYIAVSGITSATKLREYFWWDFCLICGATGLNLGQLYARQTPYLLCFLTNTVIEFILLLLFRNILC